MNRIITYIYYISILSIEKKNKRIRKKKENRVEVDVEYVCFNEIKGRKMRSIIAM